ncbi:MAG: DUF2851 family protein [Salibacteraceae bacterium]|nr:DUF2851 family protein [Salibacteraceae bacterium]MDP4845258.1 DUF2851 family protein [Salibacteraceae bacterium]MDP4963595.1 DUF2851 family protein [Salibacteraceae bacterium]
MTEEILQFVWNHKLFNLKQLETTSGESIVINHQGYLNQIAGPDFSEARITIGQTQWVGNVEIHTKSSEWMKHRHQHDEAYNNVILHVVFEHDIEVKQQNGETPKTLCLEGLIPKHILDNYNRLKFNKEVIPCISQIREVPSIIKRQALDRKLAQRLERKANDVIEIYKKSNSDWLQTFYTLLAGYLGQNTNKQPFQELSRQLPLTLLLKYQNNRFQVEALLFGVADLIPEKGDEYIEALNKEYHFLKHKHELTEIHSMWKFGGIRPPAFPTRRIAVLAAIIQDIRDLRSTLIDSGSVNELFERIKISDYWAPRFTFGSKPRNGTKTIASSLRELLIINAFAPYTYAYAMLTGNEDLKAEAIELLESQPSEKNSIIDKWKEIGFESENGADSQALIELKTNYCNTKKCVFCGIGKSILSKEL